MSERIVVWQPQPKQIAFISCPADDVGFGGARGGGKSDAVPGDFIAHENQYGEHAIAMAVRRERTQLVELIERSKQIMQPLGYKWHEQDKYFRGPKSGRLRFTYLENDSDADAYQGHSYTRIYPEEMGTFPNESPINKLQATLRSGQGVPCQMKGTCNPGGPGHQWVKKRYGLAGRINEIIHQQFEFENPWTKKKISKHRIFIPSKLQDNKYLGDNYVANLYQVGSRALVEAWLNGDWDVVEGAFFDNWSAARHVIPPFAIPDHWLRFRAADWGSARPFAIGWWTVASEDFAPTQAKVLPKGAIILYREWYGSNGQPNIGLKMPAEDVADGITEREKSDPVDMDGRRMSYGVLDPSAFSSDGGPSIAERMAKRGIFFRRADNKRVAARGALGGWDQVRARLNGDGERPMLYVFSTARDTIRTLPALQHDPDRPEDVDTESEDHAPDMLRYACMSRPYTNDMPEYKTKPLLAVGPQNQVTLEDLWEEQDRQAPERVNARI